MKGRFQRRDGLDAEKRRRTQAGQVDDQSAGPCSLDARSAPEGLTRELRCVYASESVVRVLRDSLRPLALLPFDPLGVQARLSALHR